MQDEVEEALAIRPKIGRARGLEAGTTVNHDHHGGAIRNYGATSGAPLGDGEGVDLATDVTGLGPNRPPAVLVYVEMRRIWALAWPAGVSAACRLGTPVVDFMFLGCVIPI